MKENLLTNEGPAGTTLQIVFFTIFNVNNTDSTGISLQRTFQCRTVPKYQYVISIINGAVFKE